MWKPHKLNGQSTLTQGCCCCLPQDCQRYILFFLVWYYYSVKEKRMSKSGHRKCPALGIDMEIIYIEIQVRMSSVPCRREFNMIASCKVWNTGGGLLKFLQLILYDLLTFDGGERGNITWAHSSAFVARKNTTVSS